MTHDFIADASVAVAWVHPAQATKQTDAMLDTIAEGATLEVPALWPLEVANALTVLVRRRKLKEHERQSSLGWLRGLRLRIDHEMAGLAFSRLSISHQIGAAAIRRKQNAPAIGYPNRKPIIGSVSGQSRVDSTTLNEIYVTISVLVRP